MALVLVVEDGTGLENSNTYVSLAEAETYMESRLYATAWSGATTGDKNIALVQSTRMLDQNYRWLGYQANTDQALMFPRVGILNPDLPSTYYDDESIPVPIKNAVCEIALYMLTSNRLADPSGEGISQFELADVMRVVFDQRTSTPVMPTQILSDLSKFGNLISGRSGSVRLTRV